jgi:formylglycine-generating enzyme required for sulfatase activity
MHGNVFDWCEDNWHEDYSDNPPLDGSVWEGGDASLRVLRGGSWNNNQRGVRSASRLWDRPELRFNNVGFRIGRTLFK